MSDNTTVEPSGSDPLPSASSNYDIAPEDRAIADRIVAMDFSTDSPVQFPASMRQPACKLTALAPDDRREVEAALSALPAEQRESRETEFVVRHLQRKRGDTRALIGNGPDALPYHSEMTSINAQHRSLAREFDRVAEDLMAVSHHDTVYDGNGQASAVPVLAVQGERRRHMEAKLAELARNMNLLIKDDGSPGVEGERRLRKAKFESVEIVKKREADIEDAARIKQGVAKKLRDDRVKEAIDALAGSRKGMS